MYSVMLRKGSDSQTLHHLHLNSSTNFSCLECDRLFYYFPQNTHCQGQGGFLTEFSFSRFAESATSYSVSPCFTFIQWMHIHTGSWQAQPNVEHFESIESHHACAMVLNALSSSKQSIMFTGVLTLFDSNCRSLG